MCDHTVLTILNDQDPMVRASLVALLDQDFPHIPADDVERVVDILQFGRCVDCNELMVRLKMLGERPWIE